jgi:hypothetical protein
VSEFPQVIELCASARRLRDFIHHFATAERIQFVINNRS